MGGDVLEVVDLGKRFGDHEVFSGVSFSLTPGLIYGLVGINGAGKTTLLKILGRYISEHSGDILHHGKSILTTDALDLPFRFVGDTPVFFSDLTVMEHMLFVCKNRRLSKQEATATIEHAGEALSLNDYMNHYPGALSRGTQQRLNIALASIGDAELLLLDEPFITLDPVQVGNVEELIAQKHAPGQTRVISSHNLESLERICDKYLILHNGALHEFSSAEMDRQRVLELLDDANS
jgi:ABC-type multidrug transport system ATPase subunit